MIGKRVGFIDAGSFRTAMAGLAAGLFAVAGPGEPALSIYCLDDDLFGRPRRRRDTAADKPRRETSRAPAPMPGDLKRWAPPVLVEMTRQQRRAVWRQVAADTARHARAVGFEVREVPCD